MTSSAPAPVFIQYTNNTDNTTPVEVGPVVSKSKSFRFYKKWDQADTAAQCHSNAFKIYDQQRKDEDGHMQTMKQTSGLGIRVINNASPKISDFYTKETSGTDDITANVSAGYSVEFFGFFKPTVKGNYTFSLDGTGTNHRMWIGDFACHDYLVSNQTKNFTELFPNKYYAVRFQYMNKTKSTQQVNIKARRDGADVADPRFVSLFKEDGSRFNRNLLYYGLVATNPETDKYYCYFSSLSDTAEIRESLGIDYIERSVDLQSDANPTPKTGKEIRNGSDAMNWKTVDDFYNYTITSAKYQIKDGTCLYVPETDPKKLIETYQVWTTKEVTQIIKGKNVKVKIPVLETRTRPKNQVPQICTRPMRDVTGITQDLAKTGLIKADAGTANYDAIWGGTLGQGIETQTVIDYTTRMKDGIKQNKTIRVNDKCQVMANYDTNTAKYGDAELYTSTGPNCSDKRIRLGDNGRVTINGTTWHDIGSSIPTTDRSSLVSNPSWNVPNALNIGANLSTLVSTNQKFKLNLSSVTGKLKGYYAIKATHKKSGVYYSKLEFPNAFYLYRPNYSELGGRTYYQKSATELVEVKANQLNPSWPITLGIYASIGYPLNPQDYMDTSGNCQTICKESTACGNYVKYGSDRCLIDTTSDVRPAYTTTPPTNGPLSNISMSYIYKKIPKMTSPYSFKPESAGNYSEYTVVPDELASTGSTPTVGSTPAPTTTTTSKYNSLAQYNNASSALEGFSDIPPRFSNRLPDAPETSVEEGRIADLQTIMFQQNVLYSVSSIAALSFLVGAIVLARK